MQTNKSTETGAGALEEQMNETTKGRENERLKFSLEQTTETGIYQSSEVADSS